MPVDRDELRELQAPLKDRYRAEPGAAVVTLSDTGSLGAGLSCSVQAGRELDSDADQSQLERLQQLTEPLLRRLSDTRRPSHAVHERAGGAPLV